MGDKVPLDALDILSVRFNEFTSEVPLSKIINQFISYFNITEEEKALIFSTSSGIRVEYDSEEVTSHFVRSLIGNPPQKNDWLESFKDEDDVTPIENSFLQFGVGNTLPQNQTFSVDFYERLVKKANQAIFMRSEEHTSELQSRGHLVCRLLLEKKKRI